jgi:hypothetical protein
MAHPDAITKQSTMSAARIFIKSSVPLQTKGFILHTFKAWAALISAPALIAVFFKNSTVYKIHDERQNIRRPFNDFKACSPASREPLTQLPVGRLDFN